MPDLLIVSYPLHFLSYFSQIPLPNSFYVTSIYLESFLWSSEPHYLLSQVGWLNSRWLPHKLVLICVLTYNLLQVVTFVIFHPNFLKVIFLTVPNHGRYYSLYLLRGKKKELIEIISLGMAKIWKIEWYLFNTILAYEYINIQLNRYWNAEMITRMQSFFLWFIYFGETNKQIKVNYGELSWEGKINITNSGHSRDLDNRSIL